MFYRKYFEGTIDSTTTQKSVSYYYGATNNKNIFVKQTDVLLDAIKTVLETCGCDVNIDYTNYYIWVNGIPLSIAFTSATAYSIYIPYNSSALVNANGASYIPFSGANYKFYITVKGDPDGLLDVYIGTYSNPGQTNVTYSFSVGKGKDNRNNSDIVVVGLARNANTYVYKKMLNSVTFVDGKSSYASFPIGFALTNDNDLTIAGQQIPLVENVFPCGFFKLNNCYLGHSYLTVDNFYSIDGDVYYVRDNACIVKCTNIPS